MSEIRVELPQRRLGETSRTDLWWLQPAAVFAGFMTFIVYSTIMAFFGGAHAVSHAGGADYLSPFFSPMIFDPPGITTGHAVFGPWPEWWPAFLPASPALLILWAPGGFRFTCYYYRGAYYKAFWGAPPACAVAGPHNKRYMGERRFPLIMQNIHRYFLYLAVAFLFILSYDAWRAMWFTAEDGTKEFGIAVGTLVLIINPILLGGYTLGCHSMRHLIGGRKDCLGSGPSRKAYDCVSCLNRSHMRFAWLSLFWVGFTDLYVRLTASGTIPDIRFF